MEGLFKGVFGDSSASKVDEALSTMTEVDALVRQVDAVKGADRKATHIAEIAVRCGMSLPLSHR